MLNGAHKDEHDKFVELLAAARGVVLADSCSENYTCEGLVQDALWFGGGEVELDDGKPLCPWIVRPGKCQPEVAMYQLSRLVEEFSDD